MVAKNKKNAVAVSTLRVVGVTKKARRARKRRAGRARGMFSDTSRTIRPFSMRAGGFLQGSVPAGYATINPSNGVNVRTEGDFVVVSRCELLSTFVAGATEVFTTPLVGALVPANLPWLQGVAQNFSKWRWVNLRMVYMPTCPTTQDSAVGYGFGYDMAESAATSLAEFSAFDQFKLHSPWTTDQDGIILDTGRFSRDWYPYIGKGPLGALTVAADRNIYCPAYLATYTGITTGTAGVVVGSIFIEYVVELADPISAALQPSS